ncbi:unnamed protein product [Trichogramma brassicae]|uniref:DUF7041 domain-containing protein n=1 Tax=Trichogramma brassicae TaxID=86971 RepID=A0A6H5HS75_9HYME|nr:unnamed protein product [Trichogramma brassicae]
MYGRCKGNERRHTSAALRWPHCRTMRPIIGVLSIQTVLRLKTFNSVGGACPYGRSFFHGLTPCHTQTARHYGLEAAQQQQADLMRQQQADAARQQQADAARQQQADAARQQQADAARQQQVVAPPRPPHAEAQFALADITVELTKYYHVISQLDVRAASEVEDIISSPPGEFPYTNLRQRLIDDFQQSEEHRVRQLLPDEELGDRKPSQFLRHLKSLAAPTVVQLNLLRHLWLRRLPTHVQTVVDGPS